MSKTKTLILAVLLVGCVTNTAIASYGMDVYRSKYVSTESIKQQFGDRFEVMSKYLTEMKGMDVDVIKLYIEEKYKVESALKKTNRFAFVSISGIQYGPKHIPYFTVDVVDKDDAARLNNIRDNPHVQFTRIDYLMQPMAEYLKVLDKIIFDRKEITEDECPVWHCLAAFDEPGTKRFLPLFNQLAEKNKWKLVNILRNDRVPSDREKAALMLAHINNPHELIDILYYSIRDHDAHVRNNVMRVLAATIAKSHVYNLPIDDVLLAIDFPETTDRNKALYVLHGVVTNTRKYDNYITLQSGQTLLDNLKLMQPNIHSLSHMILKLISGQNFGEHDYAAWETWIKHKKLSLVN